MRIRPTLTVLLVVLALVPLVASALLLASSIQRNHVSRVDGRLTGAVSEAGVAYGDSLREAQSQASALAERPDVRYALSGRGDPRAILAAAAPNLVVELVSGDRVIAGHAPSGPAWGAQVDVGPARNHDSVMVWQPFGLRFVRLLERRIAPGPHVALALVVEGTVVAWTQATRGPVSPVITGESYDASFAGHDVRAVGLTVPAAGSAPVNLFATYPSAELDSSIRHGQLELLGPLGLVYLLVLGAATRRMRPLLRAPPASPRQSLRHYGSTLAATHDVEALAVAVLEIAVETTDATTGELTLTDPAGGSEREAARIGEPPEADAPQLSVAIERGGKRLGQLTLAGPIGGTFAAEDADTLAELAAQAGVAIENAQLHRTATQDAVTDPLTGLANRRQLFAALAGELERAQRFETDTALILFDLDNFKLVNDALGHLAGDAVLRAVAETMKGIVREIDVAARYGGEEFAVLLPQTDRKGAANLAERLRAGVAGIRVEFEGHVIEQGTASFGVAATGPSSGSTADLVAAADAALYTAKHAGKNTVV